MPQSLTAIAPKFDTWDSSSGPENLPPYIGKGNAKPARLTVAENCRFSQEGGVSIRLGYVRKATLGTGAKVDSMEGFLRAQVAEVLFAKSGTQIFQSQDPDAQVPTFYDIGVTRTASQKDFFFMKRKDMFAINPIDNHLRIFTTSLSEDADVANARFKIPKGDTDDLANTGTVYIRGIAVTYIKAVTYTADNTTDFLTANNHGLENGVIVVLSNTGGAAPTGLTVATTYFVVNKTANTFQLSATLGGSPIDFSSDGTGTNTFIAQDGFMRQATGLTADMVEGDIVTQSTTYADNPKGSCMAELLGSCLLGGVLSDPTALEYSRQSTKANPEYFYDFSGDGSGDKPMPRDITAMLTGTSVTLIGLVKGLQYATEFGSGGVLLTAPLNANHPIPNAKSITQLDEDFAMMTATGKILPIGQTDAGFKVVENLNDPSKDMDFPVQKYIKENMDKGNVEDNFQFYDPDQKTLSSCMRLLTGVTTEIIRQMDVGAWSRDTGKSFSCKATFKGRTYCGSDSTDIIFLQDEGLDDDGLDISFRIVSGIMNLNSSKTDMELMHVGIGGLLSAIGEFEVNVYTDGTLSHHQLVTAEELIEKGLMNVDSGNPIGAGQIAADRIGNGGSGISVFKFNCPIELLIQCKTIQLEIISEHAIEIRNFDVDIENEGEEVTETL